MSQTGNVIALKALREIMVVDPIESGHPEQLADAILVANDLLDTWRTMKLTIGGVVINTHSLTADTQTYTIGDGGVFDQPYPQQIESWSVVPDDDADEPDELPMGRPFNYAQWQRVRNKEMTSGWPTVMYFDRLYAAGLGTCYFYPVPDNDDVDVKLYCKQPVITSLVSDTEYDLRPAASRALNLCLALELWGRYNKQAEPPQHLQKRADMAFGQFQVSNLVIKESSRRPEFGIGSSNSRRTFNIYSGNGAGGGWDGGWD